MPWRFGPEASDVFLGIAPMCLAFSPFLFGIPFLIFFTFYLYTFHSFSYSLCASRSLCFLRCIDFVKPMKDTRRRLYLCNLWKTTTTTTTTSMPQPQFISCNGYETCQIISCMFLNVFFFLICITLKWLQKRKRLWTVCSGIAALNIIIL